MLKNNIKRQRLILLLAIACVILAILCGLAIYSSSKDDEVSESQNQTTDTEEAAPAKMKVELTDQATLDNKIQTILDEFNSYEPVPPAEEFVYVIKDSQIQNIEIEPTDQILWDLFSKVAVNKNLLNTVTEMRIFGQTSQELDTFLAFVQSLSTTDDDWTIGINYDEISNPRDTVLTFIHEYMHIVSLQDKELVSTDEFFDSSQPCTTLYLSEGCAEPDSILNKWHDSHWKPNNLTFSQEDDQDTSYSRYFDNQALFINDYAATNPVEDFAETFAYWVLNDETVPSAKKTYLDNDESLILIKNQIRASLVK